MTDPHDPARLIVLDSSVLVGYERVISPSGVLRETQAWVGGWLLEGARLIVPAVSLAIASAECNGVLPELGYLLSGDPDQVLVVPLVGGSAIDVGAALARTGAKELTELEVAHVVWCATGGTGEEQFTDPWPVATYWPDWYADKAVPVITL